MGEGLLTFGLDRFCGHNVRARSRDRGLGLPALGAPGRWRVGSGLARAAEHVAVPDSWLALVRRAAAVSRQIPGWLPGGVVCPSSLADMHASCLFEPSSSCTTFPTLLCIPSRLPWHTPLPAARPRHRVNIRYWQLHRYPQELRSVSFVVVFTPDNQPCRVFVS